MSITKTMGMWWKTPTHSQLGYNGVQLKSVNEEENTYNLLLSNDNSLYRNYTEVILQP